MSKQELLPPQRPAAPVTKRPETVSVTVSAPKVRTGDPVSSAITRWVAGYEAKTVDALTVWTRAEASLFDAQARAAESYARKQRAAFELQELPEKFAHELRCRRVERAEEFRQAQHKYELSELHRLGEIAHAETTLTDAQQQLQAQREFGYTTYELAWKKKTLEILDVELSAAERRAIMERHISELNPSFGIGNDDLIEDALYEKRTQLNASGLDTSRIDAELERRQARRK